MSALSRVWIITITLLLVIYLGVYWAVPQYAMHLADSGMTAAQLSPGLKMLINVADITHNSISIVTVAVLLIAAVLSVIVSRRA